MFNPQFASDADRITHVLLADGQWHIPFVGTFEVHGSEFTFQELTYPAADSRGERQISGPLSSVLAVRRLVEERAIGGPAVSLDEVDKALGWDTDGMNDALDANKICTALFSAIGTSMVRAAATTKTQMSDVKGQRPAPVPRPGFHVHIDPRRGQAITINNPVLADLEEIAKGFKAAKAASYVRGDAQKAEPDEEPTKVEADKEAQDSTEGHMFPGESVRNFKVYRNKYDHRGDVLAVREGDPAPADHIDALAREIEKIENMPDRIHAANALKAVRRTLERAEGGKDD